MAEPETTLPQLRRSANGLLVVLNGELTDRWRCVECEENSGGARTSYAVLEYVGQRGQEFFWPWQIIDLNYFLTPNYEVAIARESDQAVIHWGRATQTQLAIEPHGQAVRLVSRFEPYHLGRRRLTGVEVYPPDQSATGQKSELDVDFVFNPVIDGRLAGNMGQDSLTGYPYKAFLDPEMARTRFAWEYNNLGDRPEYWTLLEVLLHLFWRCNPWQTHVLNPSREELIDQLGSLAQMPGIIRNRRIRWGSWLGEALDQVLNPLGFVWALEHRSALERTVRVFSAADYSQEVRKLGLQLYGDPLDTRLTELRSLSLSYSASQIVNHVEVVCDHCYIESTFELGRGWPRVFETNNPGTLYDETVDGKTNPQWLGGNGEARNAWRRWVCAEASQYDAEGYERTEADVNALAHETPLDFHRTNLERSLGQGGITQRTPGGAKYDVVFGALERPTILFARQRKFLPTLTRDEFAAEPIGSDVGGTVIEWSEKQSPQETDWRPITELLDGTGCSVELLDNEMGIYIRGQRPPQALIAAGENAKIRITATIRCDRRERVFPGNYDYDGEPPSGEHSEQSILASVATHPVDAGSRFQARLVAYESKFYPQVADGSLQADLIDEIFEQPTTDGQPDDPEARKSPAKRFADEMLRRFNIATASGTAVLEGLDRYRYRLGDAILGIEGKSITWNLDLDYLAAPRVVAIRYDEERQTTTLVLGTESPTAREVI